MNDGDWDFRRRLMSDPHGHHGKSVAGLPFSEADWQAFKKDDIGAGGAVIVLMAAIFSIGLFLYTIIAVVVAS